MGAQLENGNSKGINGKQNDLSAEDSGALYLFTRTGTTWVQKAYVKGSNTEAYDEFGSSMAFSKDGKTDCRRRPRRSQRRQGHQRQSERQLGHGRRRRLHLHEPIVPPWSADAANLRGFQGLPRCGFRRR